MKAIGTDDSAFTAIFSDLHMMKLYKATNPPIIRIICSAKPYFHTEGLYRGLGLLKVAEIYHFLVGQFMFRYHHKMLPQIFDQYFVKHSAIHHYSTRQSDLYLLPDYEKDIGRRSITFLGVKIWKQIILAKIDWDTSQPIFKRNLRRCMQQGTINTVFLTQLQA